MHGILDGKVGRDVPELGVPRVKDTDREAAHGSDEGGLLGGHLGHAVSETEERDCLAADPEFKERRGGSFEMIRHHLAGEQTHLEAVDSEDTGEGLRERLMGKHFVLPLQWPQLKTFVCNS